MILYDVDEKGCLDELEFRSPALVACARQCKARC